jgi:hypothetical protein
MLLGSFTSRWSYGTFRITLENIPGQTVQDTGFSQAPGIDIPETSHLNIDFNFQYYNGGYGQLPDRLVVPLTFETAEFARNSIMDVTFWAGIGSALESCACVCRSESADFGSADFAVLLRQLIDATIRQQEMNKKPVSRDDGVKRFGAMGEREL